MGDERLANEMLVKIPSLNVPNTPPLFLIPGIEGQSIVFNTLCSKLKPATYALQLGVNTECDTILSMAETFYKVVTSIISSSQDFNIIAYSYGSLIAIELALLLEESGYKGRILFIDGSPTMVTTLFHNQLATGITESHLQSSLLCTIMSILAPVSLLELKVRFILRFSSQYILSHISIL